MRFSTSLFLLFLFPVLCIAQGDIRMQPWSAEMILQNLTIRDDFRPFPVYQERDFWAKIQKDERLKDSLQEVIPQARELAKQDLPMPRASIYLDFQRTGNRRTFERILGQRSEFLETFALAECLEGKGEFLDPLMDAIWDYCEQSDWCMPAHTKGLPDMEMPHIDLGASHTGAVMAELLYLFGDALPDAIHQRVRFEVNRRIIDPYLQRDFSWVTTLNNWNSVCNGNVLRTALYLVHDKEKLGRIIQKVQNGICHYLHGFGDSGGTAEGIGYWNYGFSRYVYAAHFLNLYTNNRLNLFAPPIVKEIAQFPARIELSVDHYPSFSDGGEVNSCPVELFSYLADALDLPRLRQFSAARIPDTLNVRSLNGFLYNYCLADLPKSDTQSMGWEPFTYLKGVQWMISRVDEKNPDSLVLAAKGGRNDESHNHNDVGNFIVHLRGESLIADIGAPVYDRDFFSGKRYTYLTARSYGHSVPLVNGCEQRNGHYGAKNVQVNHSTEKDTLESDIADAYPPEAGLDSLQRSVSLVRDGGPGAIEYREQAMMKSIPGKYETAFITFGQVKLDPDNKTVLIYGEKGGLKITYAESGWSVAVEELSSKEAHLRVANQYPVVRRIAFQCEKPGKTIQFAAKIFPLDDK